MHQPNAVVVCCGADSIVGDRLGCWNLTLKGHGEAIRYVRSFNAPVIVLGDGGFTPNNVGRCWAYETALCMEEEIGDDIPHHFTSNYFGPVQKLHLE